MFVIQDRLQEGLFDSSMRTTQTFVLYFNHLYNTVLWCCSIFDVH